MSIKKVYQKTKEALTVLWLTGRCRWPLSDLPGAAIRHIRLCRKHQFSPIEAFHLGIFNPRFCAADLETFLSRKNTTRLQEILNPTAIAPLLKNKAIFYQHCKNHELPIPRLYGFYNFTGKTFQIYQNGSFVPADRPDLFYNFLPDSVALKPVDGAYGNNFRILTRSRQGFADHTGKFYSYRQLTGLVTSTSRTGALFQEVLVNHPEILSLSGAIGLQTVRLTTLAGPDQNIEILYALYKTITSKNIVIDTFLGRDARNLEVLIDPADGSLQEACYLDGRGRGIIRVENHPITGRSFRGFRIPFWPQVCQLALRAALTVLPIRAVGWDIAVTPDGPYIIEGNIWWDPPNQHQIMAQTAEKMKASIAELNPNATSF